MHSKGGYRKPIVVIAPIFYHRNDHYVRPNRVAFKYPNFKKDVDPNVHVRMFNFVLKTNVEIFEIYIINAFNYTFRDTTSNWCHNYMSKFPNFTFLGLSQVICKRYQKTQNDQQIYMELKNMKQVETKRVEVYYEQI